MRNSPRTAAAPSIGRIAATMVAAAGLTLSTLVAPASAADGVPTSLTAGVSRPITLPAADGYRDDAVLTLTSDAAITVKGQIEDANGAPVGAPLPDVELTDPDADGVFSGTHTLIDLGLAAGEYTLVLSESVADTVATTTPLIIGSGAVVQATLSAPAAVFPYKDGHLDALQAKVKAYDETGTAVPYAGTVKVTSGAKTKSAAIASPTAVTVSASVSILGFPLGAGSVVATVKGNAGSNFTTDPVPVTFLSTKVSSVAVTKSVGTIYPTVDGYQDTGSFTITPVSSTGKTLPATGKVAITLNGKTVKSWTLTSTAKKTLTWDGRTGGKIVSGKYTVTVSLKGPESSTKTASTQVNVSVKKLVTKTKTETWDAATVLDDYVTNYEFTEGECYEWSDGVVDCIGYDAAGSSLSVVAFGSLPTPTAVRSAVSASVKVTANVDSLFGTAYWNYYYGDTDGLFGEMAEGNSTLGWLTLKSKTTRLEIDFALSEYSFVYVDYYKVEYKYKVLV